ncbi:hypothetical protein PCO31010_04558 [Pandoraea commovens]|uniref:Uncharacterized protein n=1 Tax=Pandoraea commovens TaxID=2508289 RepID=A0A5E4YIE7_9BURK|nr:hypothetical protein PCO31010_04558 [Pandoraea commovens]
MIDVILYPIKLGEHHGFGERRSLAYPLANEQNAVPAPRKRALSKKQPPSPLDRIGLHGVPRVPTMSFSIASEICFVK